MEDAWDRLERAPVVDRYQELIDNGVPPSVARLILGNPSYAEDQNLHPYPGAGPNPWPYPYQGQRQDWISGLNEPNDQSLDERLLGSFRHNPGARNIGYTAPNDLMLLPSGQYSQTQMTPQMLDLLRYYLGRQGGP